MQGEPWAGFPPSPAPCLMGRGVSPKDSSESCPRPLASGPSCGLACSLQSPSSFSGSPKSSDAFSCFSAPFGLSHALVHLEHSSTSFLSGSPSGVPIQGPFPLLMPECWGGEGSGRDAPRNLPDPGGGKAT